MRRAHHSFVTFADNLVGTLALCPPYEAERLLIPRIEIFAGRGRRGEVRTWAVRPASPARETFAAGTAFKSGRTVHLRLRAGDEGGQAIDAAGIGNHRLRLGLRLILRLRTVLAFAIG